MIAFKSRSHRQVDCNTIASKFNRLQIAIEWLADRIVRPNRIQIAVSSDDDQKKAFLEQ